MAEDGARSGGAAQPGRKTLAKYYLRLGDHETEAELEETADGLRVNLDGIWRDVSLQRLGDSPRYLLVLDDRMIEVLVAEESQAFNVQIAGQNYEVETVRRRTRGRTHEADSFVGGRWSLRAPLTGVVVETRVEAGQAVEQGDILLVVEAMKMLNELRARVSGVVSQVPFAAGDRVEIGEVLVEISETP